MIQLNWIEWAFISMIGICIFNICQLMNNKEIKKKYIFRFILY